MRLSDTRYYVSFLPEDDMPSTFTSVCTAAVRGHMVASCKN
jgi:hypothetical protein